MVASRLKRIIFTTATSECVCVQPLWEMAAVDLQVNVVLGLESLRRHTPHTQSTVDTLMMLWRRDDHTPHIVTQTFDGRGVVLVGLAAPEATAARKMGCKVPTNVPQRQ